MSGAGTRYDSDSRHSNPFFLLSQHGPAERGSSALHRVIVGGESGPGAWPVDPERVRVLRDQCVVAGVPFFLKQWGGTTPKAGGRELDGETWDQCPLVDAVAVG